MMSQDKEFTGKVALITGAGSGIGKAAALLLARQGARVAALGRTDDELQETVQQIQQEGGEAMAVLADISKPDEMEKAYANVQRQFGGLHIVFANAGINGVWAPIEELEPDEWDKTMNINLRGTFLTLKYAIPLLKENGGSVIITASVNGTRIFSNTGATAYSTTKAGQVAFTKMAALELAKHRIRVNVICPGAIETNIDENTQKRDLESAKEPVEFPEGVIPLTDGKPGTSEQVAELVAFLASDRASHITGTPIWIDGAESLLMG
ncbi:NAD(P)-dependent dehydrogenase (short-subunit alcohol dehydrogenase family) [Larkinella arboricola]|uniref:NAD(P)-dependent dehydrogenase (Short-subunit alcohol dehydrogenase family) n=1 Tax=Larkinella arboricola TaxID=643671 RepID=A0A327WS70_LARAB|nr:SDR family NAD(P)-dependent oxidoreductase [Larkinella arboricola]RAJ94087.1 NAD(P)-dependent dehydrogenase (short-subunit alcohol dehydrogenase family) [Larkinella arboricola]